jgi:putative oxidoreductase
MRRLFLRLFHFAQLPGKAASLGHLIARVGLGLWMLIDHGWQHLIGGVTVWSGLGAAMSAFGITFFPAMWGFFAAMAEALGAAFFAIGFLTRASAFFLAFTMLVAMTTHLKGARDPSLPLVLMISFAAFIFIGAGKFSVDYFLGDRAGTPRS